jgi:hypothetical protein
MKYYLSSVAIACCVSLSTVTPMVAKPKTPATPQKEVLWDWWYVHGAGQSPAREITYIDALSVQTRVDNDAILSGNFDPRKPASFVEAAGVTIFEDAKNKPARTNGRVRVKCDTQQMMFLQSYRQYWQSDRFEQGPPTRWFDANSDLKFAKIAHFLCKPKERNHKNMMMRVDQTSDPLDRTWDLAWSDVPKPKFKSSRTKAQAQAEFDKAAAQAQATIDNGMKEFTEKRQQMLRDEKVTAMEQRALFSKMRAKATPLLHSWLGAEERSLVASWGNPSSSYDARNARFLTYTEGYATQMQDQYGNVQPGSRQEFYCDMTFEIRNGIVKDYRSGGNYCGSASRGKPRGPN